MGWRGAVRSGFAAARAIDRANNRARREQIRADLAEIKRQELHNDAKAVARYEGLISDLTAMHRRPVVKIDWNAESLAKVEFYEDLNQLKHEIENFRPSLIQKLIGGTKKALAKKQARYAKALEDYQFAVEAAGERRELARLVLKKDPTAMAKAFDLYEVVSSDPGLGDHFALRIVAGVATVELDAHEFADMPTDEYRLLKSGRASVNALSESRRNKIHLENVCSASLRVAAEVFGLLPVDTVTVHVRSDLLDKSTGRENEKSIAKIHFVRETMDAMDLERVDPVLAVKRFVHEFNFHRKTGFSEL
jgi:hypothetical protein